MKLANKVWNYFFGPRADYQPLIEIRIFRDALLNNLKEFQGRYPKLTIAPVLKSNAYGHGLALVAEVFNDQKLPFLVVDSFYEALTLRQHGVKTKIVILGFVRPEELLRDKIKNVSVGITSLDQLKVVADDLKIQKTFHLKIDTGMHRQGILPQQLTEGVGLIKKNPNIILEGVCSHFADADGDSEKFTRDQIVVWQEVVDKLKSQISGIKYFHLANTAGTAFEAKYCNVARVGIGLYGIDTKHPHLASPLQGEEKQNLSSPGGGGGGRGGVLNLKPALEMISVIGGVKNISAGEMVGYGITFESQQPMKIATVPVGYNEGVDRRLSNQGGVYVQGKFCPLVGRVSMNMSAIDVSELKEVNLGQEVQVISPHPADKNSVESMAKLCGCLPYEILVHLPPTLRRVMK